MAWAASQKVEAKCPGNAIRNPGEDAVPESFHTFIILGTPVCFLVR